MLLKTITDLRYASHYNHKTKQRQTVKEPSTKDHNPQPERRQILKRSFASSTDRQQDLAFAWKMSILADGGLFAHLAHYI